MCSFRNGGIADMKKYVVMRRSGAIMPMRDGFGGACVESEGPYLSILERIATEPYSDPPDKLFLNGDLVVASGLLELALAYREDRLAARSAADTAVCTSHMPAWLPEDEIAPVYIVPGADDWLVTKKRP
jgi:hypothetical protein